MFMWLQLTIKDIIDILLVAIILYGLFRLLRKSGAVSLFWGIWAFIVVWFLSSYVFSLELTGALFSRFMSVGVIALLILFQDEIRAFFAHIGSHFRWHDILGRVRSSAEEIERNRCILKVATACKDMAHAQTGALIVFCRSHSLEEYVESGELIRADISVRLIENIFFKNTPLHDGALIVRGGKLCAAACILPVSKRTDIPKSYGLRHRAALGITEKTDAVAVVVSEETGRIALSANGEIRTLTTEELSQELNALLQ